MPPKDKKAPPAKWHDALNDPVSFLIFLFIISTLAAAFMSYLGSFNLGSPEFIWFRIKQYFLLNIWPTWKVVSAVLSALAIYGIVHNLRGLRGIDEIENKIFNPALADPEISPQEAVVMKKYARNERWEKVLGLMNSSNSSDWRLAIMEADVMLEELLSKLGLHGDSLGEMLKSADSNTFSTLDEAWDAHKVRNQVAHAGTDFQLTDRETKRVIAQFEKVFKEFGLIAS